MGTQLPAPKRDSPQFSAHTYCSRTAGWMKMPLGTKVGLSPSGDSVRWGPSPLLPTKGVEPPLQFSAHFYCGKTAGCIKMPLVMEVGLRPGDFVLDGDPAPLPKKEAEPIFGPCLLWLNGQTDQDDTWHGGRPWSSPHCARWGHSSPPQKGDKAPIFGPSLLWSNGWMHQDAT